MQANKKTASTVARMVVDGKDYGEIMNRYIEFDNDVWREIVGSEKAEMMHFDGKQEPDTIKWLHDVAAKALAKEALKNENPELVLRWFFAVVRNNM